MKQTYDESPDLITEWSKVTVTYLTISDLHQGLGQAKLRRHRPRMASWTSPRVGEGGGNVKVEDVERFEPLGIHPIEARSAMDIKLLGSKSPVPTVTSASARDAITLPTPGTSSGV